MALTLLTGASGFIGSHLAPLLLARGDTVRVTVRPGSPVHGLDGLDVEQVVADVRDRRAVKRALRGVERVFHLAGTTNLRLPRREMLNVTTEGTRTVLQEALQAGVQRAVLTSSAAAIGPAPPGRVATEAQVWDAGGFRIAYADAKHAAEMIALSLAAHGLPLVIVNPAHVLGAGDPGRSSTTLVRRFLRRQIPVYVDGTLNVVGVDDVARGHVLADERGVIGERYILGNRNFTWDRLFADLGRLSGVEPPPVKLPALPAEGLARAAQRAGVRSLPSPEEVRAASLRWAFSSAKAKRELGWRTSPHEDCLEATIAWYRQLDGERLALPGTRQPLPLRAAATVARRLPRVSA